MLDKLNLHYLHELDPTKIYAINLRTGAVTLTDAPIATSTAPGPTGIDDVGLFDLTTAILPGPNNIHGVARSIITCPLRGQLAEVDGFMASTVSRDPAFGIRHGFLEADDFLTTVARVEFDILKIAGGAKNPMNRTIMQTTHTGTCGEELQIHNNTASWPPLRNELTIDDTGSMGSELTGVKSALGTFVSSLSQQRGVSYELISFKDSPSLRLANTEDSAAAIAAVQSLFPSGGGDCPEDGIGAINMALNNAESDENSETAIVFVTDASPRGGDVGAVIARAQAAGIKVHVMLSGDCVSAIAAAAENGDNSATAVQPAATESAYVVYERIARETGGLFFYKPGGTARQYATILSEIFDTALTGGDNEPPEVTVQASPSFLWPVNHKMIPISLDIVAVDNKDPHPVLKLESITSSEEADGQGDGNTAQDILVADDGTVWLRAERSGAGTDRVYTITYRATDANGNVGFGSAKVIVPHQAPK